MHRRVGPGERFQFTDALTGEASRPEESAPLHPELVSGGNPGNNPQGKGCRRLAQGLVFHCDSRRQSVTATANYPPPINSKFVLEARPELEFLDPEGSPKTREALGERRCLHPARKRRPFGIRNEKRTDPRCFTAGGSP